MKDGRSGCGLPSHGRRSQSHVPLCVPFSVLHTKQNREA
jgi:hypothetical protein